MATTSVPGDKATKDAINQFNLEMRQQPWYNQYFADRGLNPNQVKLSKEQRKQLEALAIANGAPPDAFDDMMIDPAGNLNTEHGFASLPTWAKIAIGAGVATGGFFAAPVVGNALGIVGPGGVPNAVPAVSGSLAPTLPATPAALTGTAAKVAAAAKTGLSTMDKIGSLLQPVGRAVGAATESAAQRQADLVRNQLTANGQNITGENAFQAQQEAMAKLDAQQRDDARKNLYRASVAKNPQVSVENARGAPTFSPEMLEGLTNLEKQALLRTAEEPQYTTGKMRKPRDYQPLDVEAMSRPSTMQTIGNWLAPGLSIADIVGKVF